MKNIVQVYSYTKFYIQVSVFLTLFALYTMPEETTPLTGFACSLTTQDSKLHIIHVVFLFLFGRAHVLEQYWLEPSMRFLKSFLQSNAALTSPRPTPPHIATIQ